ncbi:MAG: HD domain-containing protein [Colwellia sp.]|nr:HD domain-containing protein [Colwellia sp.]
MNQFDSIYGNYSPKDWLTPLIQTPVVQRLRWVALSNIPSLTYPMISGVSRYAHSLGVSHLGEVLATHLQFSDKDRRTLICAGLLHDAGMPPLGHITEEALGSVGICFDHEESLRRILLDEGRRFHQMPDGEKVGLTEAINKIHADSNEIFETIIGKGRLGEYLASNIDIDNIDNVIRLYRLIFPGDKGYCPESIVREHFSETVAADDCRLVWGSVRKKLYTKLMFSIEDFAQKATMKRVIKAYLELELSESTEDDVLDSLRFLNDAEFLNKILSRLSGTKQHCSFYSGKFDKIVSYGWVDSIEKGELLKLRKTLVDDNYYFDFIPDKRSKKDSGVMARGALVGLFSYGGTNKSKDTSMRCVMIEKVPGLRENYTPESEDENHQLSFI